VAVGGSEGRWRSRLATGNSYSPIPAGLGATLWRRCVDPAAAYRLSVEDLPVHSLDVKLDGDSVVGQHLSAPFSDGLTPAPYANVAA